MAGVVRVAQRIVGLRRPGVGVVAADQPAEVLPDLTLQVRRQPRQRIGVLVVRRRELGARQERINQVLVRNDRTVDEEQILDGLEIGQDVDLRQGAARSACRRRSRACRPRRPRSRASRAPSRLNRSAGVSSRIRSPSRTGRLTVVGVVRQRRLALDARFGPPAQRATRARPELQDPCLTGFPSEHLTAHPSDLEAACQSRSDSPASPAPGPHQWKRCQGLQA